jgi:hypothetical protein
MIEPLFAAFEQTVRAAIILRQPGGGAYSCWEISK